MKSLVFALFSTLSLSLLAQSPEEDEVNFQSTIDWLDSKLNYIYYDEVGEKWWNNTFYVNEKKEVTIKHISSDRPNTANISDKTYTIRTFRIQDINPHSLEINEIKESKGRLVKGQMLELRTYGFQELIHKTINNRKATSTSFLFLSFPKSIEDSISNYAEIVKSKFEEAIWASTQIYPTDYEHDVDRVLSALTGTFQSEEGAVWKTEVMQPHVLRLERGNGNIEYFGYDTNDHQFYLLSISAQGVNEEYFDLESETKLTLSSAENSKVFLFETYNSFEFKGQKFFRQ